jgi:hypothetical protein
LEIEPMIDKSKEVAELIDKAAKAEKSEDALRFSQAACNAGNAMCAVKTATPDKAETLAEVRRVVDEECGAVGAIPPLCSCRLVILRRLDALK